ncbi:hypothetical protein [Engelhardtia mirabilis]|uniref:Lipoprotein n=1 Tax=Engelhardtia mirabilis TaxID=2528011 RepID=A0A518BSP6_9BACT|nr:hypothetical protein Pla133_51200 [Planctomycetes bacterium Pla133]QDV04322.1 hypothetical protein Pla86_51170 [Planctomycetes bacterium Pla86]
MIARVATAAVLAAGSLLAGCMAPTVPLLSHARVAPDFDTYAIARVAVLPVDGPPDADGPQGPELRALQEDFTSFVASGTPYEVIALRAFDLDELPLHSPRLDGHWSIDGLLGVAERYRVDAVLHLEITRERVYAPLAVGLYAELVSVDTGQVIWNASVELDATDEPVRKALVAYYGREDGARDGGSRWEVALSSPQRFVRFAAWQLAQQL